MDQRRASKFWSREETTRQIRLIDAQGNKKITNQQGITNIKKHQSVMSCLEKRALRYQKDSPTLEQRDEVLYQEALDEPGTVSTSSFTKSDTDLVKLWLNA